jgi:hypothetical protein
MPSTLGCAPSTQLVDPVPQAVCEVIKPPHTMRDGALDPGGAPPACHAVPLQCSMHRQQPDHAFDDFVNANTGGVDQDGIISRP